jgi:hypothetical protein
MSVIAENPKLATNPLKRTGRAAPLRAFQAQADVLLGDDTNFDADSLHPTPRATEDTFVLLRAASEKTRLLEGELYPDEKGGLRIEWRRAAPERYLLLAVHASDARQDYLYYQSGAKRGELQAGVSSSLLADRSRWLTE